MFPLHITKNFGELSEDFVINYTLIIHFTKYVPLNYSPRISFITYWS